MTVVVNQKSSPPPNAITSLSFSWNTRRSRASCKDFTFVSLFPRGSYLAKQFCNLSTNPPSRRLYVRVPNLFWYFYWLAKPSSASPFNFESTFKEYLLPQFPYSSSITLFPIHFLFHVLNYLSQARSFSPLAHYSTLKQQQQQLCWFTLAHNNAAARCFKYVVVAIVAVAHSFGSSSPITTTTTSQLQSQLPTEMYLTRINT